MEPRPPYWKDVARLFGNIFFTLLSIIVSFVMLAMLLSPLSRGSATSHTTIFGEETSNATFLSITISGTILGDSSSDSSPLSLLQEGATYGYDVKKELYDAAKDSSISGVVLEINSPGGTVYGASAIADGVSYYRTTAKKPIIAHVSGEAASGAYWSAVAADAVYADTGSSVGSVGVYMGPILYYDKPVAQDNGLLSGGIVTQNGIEATYITAGKSKDLGNPYRKLTDAEIAVLQNGVNNEYANFVSFVSSRRLIDPATLRDTIGALIYDNKTAEGYKMIDGTKSREDTYAELAKRAKVSGDYKVVQDVPATSFIASLFNALQPTRIQEQADQNKAVIEQQICSMTRGYMAYGGDVTSLCK